MKVENYHFEPIPKKLYPQVIFHLEQQISKSIPFLEKNLERIVNYIKKENELNNFIEIDLPFFDSNISFSIFLHQNKIIISIKYYNDSYTVGHLILNGSDYMDIENIKKIGMNFT